MKLSNMKVSKAEKELIELIRTRPAFGMQFSNFHGTFAVYIVDEPRAGSRVEGGMGSNFQEAWARIAECTPGVPENEDCG